MAVLDGFHGMPPERPKKAFDVAKRLCSHAGVPLLQKGAPPTAIRAQ